ncbi:MAG TPA: laminarinase [Cytophagales bacterium]|jgi:beta-glucanase (GH16 family)|nr:laminarinase [Cytophagales bacterium]
MNLSRHLFLILLLILFISSTKRPKKEKLIWSDEFNYTGVVDSTKWNFDQGNGCPQLCGWGNNEAQIYTTNKENIRVENGLLIIEAKKNDNQWTSARINSRKKMTFTYGRIEFRAKLAEGLGSWSALWMLGESVSSKSWPACGEIDVMEHVGKFPGVIQSAMHTSFSNGETGNKGSTKIGSYNQFHVYEALWTSKSIQFFVDGINYYTYQPLEINEKTWPFDSPFFIIMNLAMGGNFGGPTIDSTLTHARMEVDYVRVYQ